MCGIAAILKGRETFFPVASLNRMRDEVTYRGPDDTGSEFFNARYPRPLSVEPDSSDWEIGLGHRRLSILDCSPTGHQPMRYRGRFWITYNGEVYNYVELRRELERAGHEFLSSGDTEVILAAYAEWGTSCFSRMRGMWAMVIYDAELGEVILCRDRLGIKPLYLWHGAGIIAAASEIKQLRHVPHFSARVNCQTLSEFLRTGYETPAETLFAGVQPLPAASWMRIDASGRTATEPETYWHPENINARYTDVEEAGHAFSKKFHECVRLHLRSDVAVGCSLSGGLDSSAIAVTANQLRSKHDHMHTFSCTFPGDATDEREYVDSVLAHIRHRAHFITPQPDTFLQDLDRFVWIHDEPVSDTAMYASYCVARLTHQAGVRVLLSGQGGDELFGAYWASYFVYLYRLMNAGRLLSLASHFIGSLCGGGNPQILGQAPVVVRRYLSRRHPDMRVRLAGSAHAAESSELLDTVFGLDERARRLYEIRTMFLPRLLKWDDRNSSSFSVEGRYPFLDHELIELVLSFDPEALYHKGWTKWALRQGLRELLPVKILKRRTKFGFETPRTNWLRTTLKPHLQDWLKSDRPAWDFLNRDHVRSLADRVWHGARPVEETSQQLFRIFVFDRWLQVFGITH